jgi:hypothetical protein
MEHQKTNSNLHRQHDDWDEVHNQLIDVQRQQKIQKKSLTISNPGDADEKEADDVARKVSNGESTEIHGIGSTINRKGEGSAETTPEFQSKLESSKGGGQSLNDSTRSEMESKMGADFSGVKVHTGANSHAMNQEVSAKAFTHGNDVYFRDGEYNPSSSGGRKLIAHELAHTVQQLETGTPNLVQRQRDYGPAVNNTTPREPTLKLRRLALPEKQ